MKYRKVVSGEFVSRPNRFIAKVKIDGQAFDCHIKNTGRLKELLVPKRQVFLNISNNTKRKTKYDLIGVNKEGRLFNIDSLAPNLIVKENFYSLFPQAINFKSEWTYANSRFDFYFEALNEKCLLEVKGVTQENGNIAFFPDAPTSRGIKHINDLVFAKESAYKTYMLFLIQFEGPDFFSPNRDIHPDFAKALSEAKSKGVTLLAYDCRVTPDSLLLNKPIKIKDYY